MGAVCYKLISIKDFKRCIYYISLYEGVYHFFGVETWVVTFF